MARLCRERWGTPLAHTLQNYRAVYRDGVRAAGRLAVSLPPIVRELREDSPEGVVIKYAQQVPGVQRPGQDALRVLETESVLIPMIGSTGASTYTLCVSSQVGCAMGCTFCETAQMGLIRSLTAEEIVAQWYAAAHHLGIRPRNIVFMGMGEPTDNIEAVIDAIGVLMDHNGPGVALSRITVSTVGRVDGIRRLAEQIRRPGWHRLGLALSLNAPNDDVRGQLMPINRRWNLQELQQALIEWPRYAGNKICVEYVLIPGVNDSPQHVREIADFVKPLRADDGVKPRAVLNLIPYNPRRNSPWPAPDEAAVDAFLASLISHGVFAKRRRTKGRQTMAACGQLGSEQIRQRRLVQVSVSA